MQRTDRLSNAYGMLFEEVFKTASSGIVAAGGYWYAERPCEHFRVQMQPSGCGTA